MESRLCLQDTDQTMLALILVELFNNLTEVKHIPQ